MRIEFTKMHGLGNDFIVLDARERALPPIDSAAASALADRHTGIGCDQLILLEPSSEGDFRMRIFNADGSEVEACGNATRAVGLLHGQPARIETLGGLLHASPSDSGISVEMGKPRFDWDRIPLAYAMDTHSMPVGWDELTDPIAVNVGNPHVIFFVADPYAVEMDRLGPLIETDPLFPERINVNVAAVTARDAMTLRVWERGAGLTRACGTGACATAIGAMKRGLVDRRVTVTLPGGPLVIEWREDGEIVMTGPATESFRGSFDPADYGMPAGGTKV
ncbi:diaminopimelate epimerase [Novosphingobium pentaromativorans]|uniref:Diaminopimelate epimerase n=1 Tax=Novosphingobium pentaromativorans US6-1 TaxID=1088721 RepID=G6EEZ4_9SPHN|nr:diaminopimelate epimerase [Novosphingobium pentaromativorans]AIT79284.1 diaminopimelate epimerase [Novosphingobium pentaromativorans US6-1]EHJ60120.1 diaminopimelate epimerase [Novosphingobium pentaromativorans US6-1]